MNYTNKELIKRIESVKKNKKNLTHITDKTSLSTEDRLKMSFCRHFVQFANSRRMKSKDIAEMINIPIQRLSEITNYKISKFSVEQLIKNLVKLAEHDAPLREYLVFLVQAAELPTLKVAETKKLTREVKQASRTINLEAHL